jgi:hypothetical protein
MSGIPVPLLLLSGMVAVLTVLLLWKLLLTAGLIGLAQWAALTQTDDATMTALVLGVPALITALTVARLVSRVRPPAVPRGLSRHRKGVLR